MARTFLTPINMGGNEIQNLRLQNLAAPPSTPVLGQAYYDTALGASYVYGSSGWVANDASKMVGVIPNAALVTNPLARANHTGTQLSATISDLSTTILANRLNQFAVPNAAIAMAGFKLTGLGVPSTAGDSAEYSWVLSRPLNQFAAPAANIGMAGFKLTGLPSPSATGDSAEYSWTLSRPLNVFAVPTANVAMGTFKLTGLGSPSGAGDSAEYSWVLGRSLSAFAAPTANIPLAGFRFTGAGQPQAAGDVAEYSWVIGQVQSAAAGISSKYPVQVVAVPNITLSGLQTIDGYTTLAGDRVLVTGQSTPSQNGVYNASAGAWTRTTNEGAAPGEIEAGALWLSVNGAAYGGTQWRCSNTGAITIGTTGVTIVQFSAASNYTAANGITLTGTAFSVNPAAGGGILVGSGGVSIDASVVARKFSATIGDGSATSYVVTHGLGTQDVHMQVRQTAVPYGTVECDMQATSATTCTLLFAAAPAASAYRVTVIG